MMLIFQTWQSLATDVYNFFQQIYVNVEFTWLSDKRYLPFSQHESIEQPPSPAAFSLPRAAPRAARAVRSPRGAARSRPSGSSCRGRRLPGWAPRAVGGNSSSRLGCKISTGSRSARRCAGAPCRPAAPEGGQGPRGGGREPTVPGRVLGTDAVLPAERGWVPPTERPSASV